MNDHQPNTLLFNLPDQALDRCDGPLYESVKLAGYDIGVRQLIDQWNAWGMSIGEFTALISTTKQ